MDLKTKQQYTLLLFKVLSVKILTIVNVRLPNTLKQHHQSLLITRLYFTHAFFLTIPNPQRMPNKGTGWWIQASLCFLSLLLCFMKGIQLLSL